MEWKYAIDVTLNHPVSVTVDVLGQQAQIRLDLRAAATNPGRIEGGITFDCETPPFIEGCYCLMHDLRRQDPEVTTNLATDVYEVAASITGATAAVLPQYITIVSPTIDLASSMQVTAINAGKAYNIFVESTLNYTPGKVIVDPPDLKNVPLPPPFNAVTIPIGPFPFSLGDVVKSVHRAEYIVSCCTWDDSLPEWSEEDGEVLADERGVLSVANLDDCGCGDFSALHIRSGAVTASPLVQWKIEAVEGPCQWKVVKVLRDADGTQWRKKKQRAKEPKVH
jgi:hypothetical protein